jgi:HEAT repeat protein
MANPGFIDEFYNNEPPPTIPSGTQRPSKRVDLQRFDAIRRRQELNALLTRCTCGDSEAVVQDFEPGDLPILLQIAHERDPNGNPAIRKHAVRALGQFRTLEVMEVLWRITSDDLESEAVRGQALLALAHVTPSLAPSLLKEYLDDESALIRQVAVSALTEGGDQSSVKLVTELLEREQDIGVRQRAPMAVQSIGKPRIPESDM